MIQYAVNTSNAHRHFISFEACFETHGRETMPLQLPSWRPGRYELGNFAKNIRNWRVTDSDGNALAFEKVSRDLWIVRAAKIEKIVLRYTYYAAELNAGSSFLDEHQLYINPVNCFFYDADYPQQRYRITLHVPSDYTVACGLSKESQHVLLAESFDELADCPLIASNTLRRLSYRMREVDYHLWIQGEVRLNETELIRAFESFTAAQLDIFGDIPCKDYHFLFHFVPYFLRHGVEHSNSTVIAMGPAADFQQDHLYKDLLGISCHELFHTWNVKSIRPVEMMPYDFTGENYSQSGFVYEGVTTYYGDMLLWRSGALSDEEWLDLISDHLQDHFTNHGRKFLSVAQSSIDTWLDGYVAGIPWRKVSIYNEGFLIAMISDLFIRRASQNTKSLDDLMHELYVEFGKRRRGYSKADYEQLLMKYSNGDLLPVISSLINGTSDYLPFLREALALAGVNIQAVPSGKFSDAQFGLSVEDNNQKITVSAIVPESPADQAGLWYGDEIVGVNGVAPYKNFQHLLRMYAERCTLTVLRKGKRYELVLSVSDTTWVYKYKCEYVEEVTQEVVALRQNWKNGTRI